MWYQQELRLASKKRGFHLITHEIEAALARLKHIETGILHLFIKHTSASLSINENADPDVRHDLESHFNNFVPENAPYYLHTLEGSDDMPAHIKNCILGSSLTIPISEGTINMGTWQGIYLCEHRNHAAGRLIVATVQGQAFSD
ncbi:MAG TPA: YjbQ family protein [Gammaproteobacteria bacterium]|nr:YjbQ family protein [Gammaproteobacteria bacterium]